MSRPSCAKAEIVPVAREYRVSAWGAAPAEETAAATSETAAASSTRITGNENGCYGGHVLRENHHVATLKMSVAGTHNLFNATAAVAW